MRKLGRRVSGFFLAPRESQESRDWQRTSEALATLLELPVREREARLDAIAGGDDSLRNQLASLLRAHDASGVLDAPVLDVVEAARDESASAAPQPWSDDAVGARYRLANIVGNGGMGVVMKAWDERLERAVALKFLSSHLLQNPVARERFRVEARAIASLDHPNVCTIYDMGDASDERFFIAMPFYEGETIAARLARGPLPIAESISLARQTARGLAAAHARGIIHRDIKPANLIVTAGGVVKILDFGIAKLAGTALTAPGFAPGTAAYMSPEQSRAETVDARADLWSLGVVMYEMLTGVRPFRGASARVVAAAICTAEPEQIESLRVDVPEALALLVRSMMAKDPAHRPTSAEVIAAQLESIAA